MIRVEKTTIMNYILCKHNEWACLGSGVSKQQPTKHVTYCAQLSSNAPWQNHRRENIGDTELGNPSKIFSSSGWWRDAIEIGPTPYKRFPITVNTFQFM
jgi:hypothetical protein